MHTKLEPLLWKSQTTMEVMAYYLVVHMGPGLGWLTNPAPHTIHSVMFWFFPLLRKFLNLRSSTASLAKWLRRQPPARQTRGSIPVFPMGFFRVESYHHHHLGFVHPLQNVALHQCLPYSSVCCFPNPGDSLLLCYVILPSSAWSSSRLLPSPWLSLCASLCPCPVT